MSLEKALEANTTAVLALIEILQSNNAIAADALRRLSAIEPQPAPKKREEKVSAPSKVTPAPSAPTPASIVVKPFAETSTSLTYDDIKTPFLELAKRDLATAQALIAEFGFKTLKNAKPEQYAEILEKLSAMGEDAGVA